jgi:DNA helicase HerA-like ATPase
MSFSPRHIDYLTRSFLDNISYDPDDLVAQIPEPSSIFFVKVSSISRIRQKEEELVAITQELEKDVLVGVRGMMVPLIYLIIGEGNKVSIYIGVFSDNPGSRYNFKEEVLGVTSVFLSAFPGIDFERDKTSEILIYDYEVIKSKLSGLEHCGIIEGTPATKSGEKNKEERHIQIDRLIRGLYGKEWAYIVVGKPVETRNVIKAYNDALEEIKIVIDAETRVNVKDPIAERYKQLLNEYIKKLEENKSQGAWEICVYLLCSDEVLLRQGLGIAESMLGGENSIPDPIRSFRTPKAWSIAQSFGQITTPSPKGPGNVQHKYKYMTFLGSHDLASLMSLPTLEMPGIFVKSYARFDVFPHNKGDKTNISLGEVLDEGRKMGRGYSVDLEDLTKHCLIVGTTGSGKTNTVFHMIKQLWEQNIPFLVIEPTKKEYRKLVNDASLGKELQIFTLGDESTSPFRLNPFELMKNVSLQTHIDHLKSVFGASFPMWAPMPQVLESALHEIYEDKGWNLVENNNTRGISPNSFPTLTDLYTKIDEIVDRLGYEERVTMDVQAALKTRINSLRIGGKGLMLDIRKGVPMDRLMKKPTILELEALADDDEKALLMGLLLIFLQEYYQLGGLEEGTGIKHVTIIEEAHRLLSNVGRALDSEVANTRWKAVETFTNILSELRAYGEGFIIAEQIPEKLALDVVKNTNLKVLHKTVSEEDRKIMGGSMNLDQAGSLKVTSFPAGEALVFGKEDDSSIRIKVPYKKIKGKGEAGDKELVIEEMKYFWQNLPNAYTPFDNCALYCENQCLFRNIGGKVVDDLGFQEMIARFILTNVENPRIFFQGYRELMTKINDLQGIVSNPKGVTQCIFIQAVHRYFEKRGSQYHWSYKDTKKLEDLFTKILNNTIINYDLFLDREQTEKEWDSFLDILVEDLESFQILYRGVTYNKQPYVTICPQICTDGTCLYRYGNRELSQKPEMTLSYQNMLNKSKPDELYTNTLKKTRNDVRRVISLDPTREDTIRVALCYALQISLELWPNEPYERNRFIKSLIEDFKYKE